MRKAIVALAFLAVALLIHPAAAHASGSTVNLLTPTTGTITFTPGAGTTDMTVTGITGTAIGTGSLSGELPTRCRATWFSPRLALKTTRRQVAQLYRQWRLAIDRHAERRYRRAGRKAFNPDGQS